MPMTKRQLAQVQEDYFKFLPIAGDVVACEESHAGQKATCDICGIELSGYAAKQIVVVPKGQFGVRHYRILVCRQGTTCRKRRNHQIEYPPIQPEPELSAMGYPYSSTEILPLAPFTSDEGRPATVVASY